MNFSNAIMGRTTSASLSYPLKPEPPSDLPDWFDEDESEDGSEENLANRN